MWLLVLLVLLGGCAKPKAPAPAPPQDGKAPKCSSYEEQKSKACIEYNAKRH